MTAAAAVVNNSRVKSISVFTFFGLIAFITLEMTVNAIIPAFLEVNR